jgi:phosphate:Na+ symporter
MKRLPLLLGTSIALLALSAFSAQAAQTGSDIEWFSLFMKLAGGLALFLGGLEQLSEGLKRAAGDSLKRMLARLTTNRLSGALTGAVVTGMLNSSSITTVLVVGFVTAGVMTLSQSVGVIMGANIGSTVTAQILAFNVSQYALLPVAVGFFMIFSGKSEKLKFGGMMIMGMGLVFFGMAIMSDAMSPLRSYQPFIDLLKRMENPFLGILAGAVFTGLVQSSAATVGIAIALASEGFLALEAGIALALGANIGTCATALLAAIGKPTEAVRAAVVHIAFNIAGVILWFFFIDQLADLATAVSPSSPELQGSARLAADVPRQIANANTMFNIVNTCIFLPFTPYFAWFAEKLVPEKPPAPGPIQPAYLDESVLEVPSLALERVRQELARITEIVLSMFQQIATAIELGDKTKVHALIQEDDKVDLLESACLEYLSKIRQSSLTTGESDEHQALMVSAVALENLADVIETDLAELGKEGISLRYSQSEETRKLTNELYISVLRCIELLLLVLSDRDQEAASQILVYDEKIGELQKNLMIRKSNRLGHQGETALKMARIEVSTADKLARMYSLIKRITLENLDYPAAMSTEYSTE